jgi:hypothetical protein
VRAYGKLLFSLTIVICLTGACDSTKPKELASETRAPSAGAAEDEETPLEARCFEGDQAACDELGH